MKPYLNVNTGVPTCTDDCDGADHHKSTLEEVVHSHGQVVISEANILRKSESEIKRSEIEGG
jgi:hypothetical protein